MRQRALGILAAAILANAATSAMAEDKVFFLLPNSTTIRFESRDAPFFIEAMKSIAEEAAKTPDVVKNAPHTTRVRRLDEVGAARKPILRWTAGTATKAAR